MQQKSDAYSPNNILGTMLIAIFCSILLCGQSLWIPASRIQNLYTRSVVLSLSEAASAFASSTGLDRYVPELRSSFLSVSALAGNTAWDTRYYNHKSALDSGLAIGEGPSTAVQSLPTVNTSLAENGTAGDSSAPASVPVADPSAAAGVNSALPGGTTVSGALPPSAAAGTAGIASFRPAMGPAGVHSVDHPLKVFMFGDSQVFSLGSGLSRLAGKASPVSVDFLAIHSSGFIRSDYYNWPAKIEDTFRADNFEAAVMMLGMNDYQNFWNDQGVIMKKNTPEWEAAYKDKCRQIIDIALASVPRLYWVGMPMVKNKAYEASLAYIDSVQESLSGEYSPDTLVRISLRDTIPGPDKPYSDSVELGGGKTLKVMSADGIHYTVEGGQVAMKPLFDRLTRDYLFATVPVANLPE